MSTETKTYLFHELSSYLPLLEGDEFDALVEDIRLYGQIEPAVLYEGKLLDGRNRYRVCKLLKQDLITKEWKPSTATGSTPLQYVISENIMRRHLNTAQKAEIGMLLYDEVEKQVQEEKSKKMSEILKERHKKGELETKDKSSKLTKETENLERDRKKDKEATTAYKVAKKVRVKPETMRKVKQIKNTAYNKETGEIKDKSIAEKWEDAKRGDSSIGAVYKEVKDKEFIEKQSTTIQEAIEDETITIKEAKEITKLPAELQKAVIKPRTKTRLTSAEIKTIAELPKDVQKDVVKENISIEDAKSIAEISKPELREEAVKIIKKQKEQQKLTKDYMVDVGTGKKQPEVKIIDLDMKIINQFAQIYKQVIMKMTVRLADSYPEQTKVRLLKIMKETLIHLQKELKIKGDIIDTEKN